MAQFNEWHVRLRVRSKINVREKKNIHLDTPPVSLNTGKKYGNRANWKLGTNCSNQL